MTANQNAEAPLLPNQQLYPAFLCNIASRVLWLRQSVAKGDFTPAEAAKLARYIAPLPFETELLSGKIEDVERAVESLAKVEQPAPVAGTPNPQLDALCDSLCPQFEKQLAPDQLCAALTNTLKQIVAFAAVKERNLTAANATIAELRGQIESLKRERDEARVIHLTMPDGEPDPGPLIPQPTTLQLPPQEEARFDARVRNHFMNPIKNYINETLENADQKPPSDDLLMLKLSDMATRAPKLARGLKRAVEYILRAQSLANEIPAAFPIWQVLAEAIFKIDAEVKS